MFRNIDSLVMWASVETADQYFPLKHFRFRVDSPILKGNFAIKGIKNVLIFLLLYPVFLCLLKYIFPLFKTANFDSFWIDFGGLLVSILTLTISDHVDSSIACCFAEVKRDGSISAVPLQVEDLVILRDFEVLSYLSLGRLVYLRIVLGTVGDLSVAEIWVLVVPEVFVEAVDQWGGKYGERWREVPFHSKYIYIKMVYFSYHELK